MMEAPLRPARVTDRFLAYLVDVVPFGAAYYLLLYLLIVRLRLLPNTPLAWKHGMLACLALFLVYQVVGNLRGATLGKRMFGLRVVGLEGDALTTGQAVMRAFGYLLSTPLLNLGFLWSLFDSRSRTWHDLLAGTWVVESRPRSRVWALLSALLSFAAFALIVGGNVWWYVLRPTPHDLQAVARAREGLQALATLQEVRKAAEGSYTESLADLARASGDVQRFKAAMQKIFDPNGFVLLADEQGFEIRARALDRRRTVVVYTYP
ncbi:MAG: RDD family protein [Elusimicrobiota bacterium]